MPALLHDGLIDTDSLSFEQTIPRAWVHKRSLDNVLLTEIRACADGAFICAGRLPTVHRFFNEAGRTPHNDILFYTELGRQASLAVSHAFLNVSTDDVFIFEGSAATVTPAAWMRRHPSPGGAVVVHIEVRDLTRRKNNAVARVVTEHTMTIGSERVFHGTGAFTIQPAALFQRLRRGSAPAAVDTVRESTIGERATRVARASGDNIAISTPRRTSTEGGFEASLIVDHTHPYFFDHPCDHVPGMLLLEGCAQLALAAFGETGGADTAGLSAYDASFTRFVECGIPTALTAQVDTGGNTGDSGTPQPIVHLVISQQGTVCGTTTIRLALPTTH